MKSEEPQDEDPIEQKSMRLPRSLWALLEADATRWRRTMTSHVQFLLEEYFNLSEADHEQQQQGVERMHQAGKPERKRV